MKTTASTLPHGISNRILTHTGVDMSNMAVQQNSSIPSSRGQDFAVSSDTLYFSPGMYSPYSPEGRRVLAGAVSLFRMKVGDIAGAAKPLGSHRHLAKYDGVDGESTDRRAGNLIVVENGERGTFSRTGNAIVVENGQRVTTGRGSATLGDVVRVGRWNQASPIFIITDFLRSTSEFSVQFDHVLSAIRQINLS